ncbi:MAG: hypothetical protein J5552_01135 [Prevotella sp.]|nr:hypothetical protein [Prevotella sp.]
MTKKEYTKPLIEAYEAQMEEELLVSSLTDINITGVDTSDNFVLGGEGDAWSGAMGRGFGPWNFDDDF